MRLRLSVALTGFSGIRFLPQPAPTCLSVPSHIDRAEPSQGHLKNAEDGQEPGLRFRFCRQPVT